MRISALIIRICQQMFRDKRTLALLFIAPLFILTMMYFIFNGNNVEPKLGVVNIDINSRLVQILKDEDISVIPYQSANNETVVNDKLDGLLVMNNGTYELTLLNSDPTPTKALQMKINQAMATFIQETNSNAPINQQMPTLVPNYIYGDSNTTFFDVLSPILVGFFVFFFVFLISGIGLLREKTTGTLERLMSTPIKRREVVLGYLVGYGIFAIIQTLVIVLYAIAVLNITLAGSLWNVIIINLLLAMVALSLGILLSTFASSEFQMMQFIPIVIIPQVFFAGIFPLSGMAKWLQVLSKIMPIYYGADALKGIMYQGLGLSHFLLDILILLIFMIVFVILNIFALKKYRSL